jgi:RNA polymerase sigma-70 factor (ECF subfamily)
MEAVHERGRLPTQADFHDAIARHSDSWFSACLRITRSRELAEDAVQDGLLRAWHKRHQFQGDARLATWIHRIAVNSALQLLRKQRPGAFEPLEIDVPDEREVPERDRAVSDVGDRLEAALADLTPLERVCFVLKHLEEWTLDEIAAELDTSVNGVKQALFRGVKKLRVTMAYMRSA